MNDKELKLHESITLMHKFALLAEEYAKESYALSQELGHATGINLSVNAATKLTLQTGRNFIMSVNHMEASGD